MSTMSCPRCDGDIEYEIERVDNGDGVWAQSYDVGVVNFRPCDAIGMPMTGATWTHGMTDCACVWTPAQLDRLHDRASEHANDMPLSKWIED